MTVLLALAGAYLIGSLPSAYLLVRGAGRGDVRAVGSGNVGATNAMRAAGWKVALPVLMVDLGKGVAAVFLMRLVSVDPGLGGAATVAAVAGHCFPIWLRFDGGKGVATGGGGFAVLAPHAALAAGVAWLLALAATRYVALASMAAAALLPVTIYFLSSRSPALVASAVVAALIVIWRHRGNLSRVVRGEEPRVGGGRRS